MPQIIREPLTGRAAWRGAELTPDDWLDALDDAERAEIECLREALVARDVGLADIDPVSTPVPALATTIRRWLHRMEDGVGLVVVRGLDITRWSRREAGLVFYALGRHMGRPVKQNAQGHLLGHVRDTGRDIYSDPNARGYQVRVELPFHTDTSTDVLGLFCYRTAKTGGTSSFAPLHTIYNEVLATHPELIDVFYETFHFDCRDEEHPDGGPFYSRVLASVVDGKLSMRHNSGYARAAARHAGCPPLTERQDQLLTLIDALAGRADVRFDVALQQGDMVFINNYLVMHSRSSFEDHEEEDRKRHLLRLWLVLDDGRRLAPDFDNRAGLLTTAGISDDGLDGR